MIIYVGNKFINLDNVAYIQVNETEVKIHFVGAGDVLRLSGRDAEWFRAWSDREVRLYRFMDITDPEPTARRPPTLAIDTESGRETFEWEGK